MTNEMLSRAAVLCRKRNNWITAMELVNNDIDINLGAEYSCYSLDLEDLEPEIHKFIAEKVQEKINLINKEIEEL